MKDQRGRHLSTGFLHPVEKNARCWTQPLAFWFFVRPLLSSLAPAFSCGKKTFALFAGTTNTSNLAASHPTFSPISYLYHLIIITWNPSPHRLLFAIMAFRQTLTRSASKHISSYGTVLDRFMVSNAPAVSAAAASSSSSAAASTSGTNAASLFKPTKSPVSGCWAPPKYSLRRQAKLVKEAALTGQLPLLPDGPKSTRIQQRIARLQHSLALEEQSSQYQYVPKSLDSADAAKGVRPTALGQRVLKPSQRVSQKEIDEATMAARLQVRDVGPYAGRAKIFKGSRVDKDKSRRANDVNAKLQGMKQTVKEWHSVSLLRPFPTSKRQETRDRCGKY